MEVIFNFESTGYGTLATMEQKEVHENVEKESNEKPCKSDAGEHVDE